MAASTDPAGAIGAPHRPGRRVAVVGVSTTAICGVRDHATLLAEGMTEAGDDCTVLWLDYEQGSLPAARAALRSWIDRLPGELASARAQAIVLHYSVFGLSHRGVPLFVRPLLSALGRSGVPVVTILHEAVYPWNIGGARGKLWALTQRVALIELLRRSAALLVTAEFRAHWLSSRLWLPRRPIVTAPVYSNLPLPSAGARAAREREQIGVFGYAYEGAGVALVLDALLAVRARRPSATLALLGAPGADSPAGRDWLAEAAARGLADAVHFSGTLAAGELADALARCELLLSINRGGPSSRKGSLAGSLSSAAPVVALDGPHRWPELLDSGAIRVVAPEAGALAGAIVELLDDPAAAEALGQRGQSFAEREMGVARTVRAVEELIAAVAER